MSMRGKNIFKQFFELISELIQTGGPVQLRIIERFTKKMKRALRAEEKKRQCTWWPEEAKAWKPPGDKKKSKMGGGERG